MLNFSDLQQNTSATGLMIQCVSVRLVTTGTKGIVLVDNVRCATLDLVQLTSALGK